MFSGHSWKVLKFVSGEEYEVIMAGEFFSSCLQTLQKDARHLNK